MFYFQMFFSMYMKKCCLVNLQVETIVVAIWCMLSRNVLLKNGVGLLLPFTVYIFDWPPHCLGKLSVHALCTPGTRPARSHLALLTAMTAFQTFIASWSSALTIQYLKPLNLLGRSSLSVKWSMLYILYISCYSHVLFETGICKTTSNPLHPTSVPNIPATPSTIKPATKQGINDISLNVWITWSIKSQ